MSLGLDLPIDFSTPDLIAAYPLFGASLDMGSWWVNGLHLAVVPWNNWARVEAVEGAATDALASAYTRNPPVSIIYTLDGVSPCESGDCTTLALRASEVLVRDLVLALRLHRDGRFVDPLYTINYRRVGPGTPHLPAPYRHAPWGKSSSDGYRIGSGDLEPVAHLCAMVHHYHAYHRHSGLDLALRHYRQAFHDGLDGTTRLHYLRVVLEALLGPPGEPCRGGHDLGERLAVAATLDRGGDPVTAELSRELVTALAPGAGHLASERRRTYPRSDLNVACDQFLQVLRPALRMAVRFSILYRAAAAEVAAVAGLGAEMTPALAFNVLLAHAAAGNRDARELLTREPEGDPGD